MSATRIPRLCLGLILLTACVDDDQDFAAIEPVPPVAPAALTDRIELRDAMRKLWSDEILWARWLIVGTGAGLPDTSAAQSRWLQVQDDMGGVIKPFYGVEAGDALTALFRDYVFVGVEVISALIAAEELPDLIRSKRRSDIWIFAALLLAGMCLGVAQSLRIGIPNPLDAISFVFAPVGRLLEAMFM